MLKASPELTAAATATATATSFPGSLWFPGGDMQPVGVDMVNEASSRAQEFARRRDELFGLLRDVPESEYELSLTDLVEKDGGEATDASGTVQEPKPTSRRPGQAAAKERRRRRRGSSSSSFRSSSDGVLLNFYLPSSLSRSSTTPRQSRREAGGSRAPPDCNLRDQEPANIKCWPALWDRRWRKSRGQASNAPDETRISLASLAIRKGADHTPSPKF